MTWAALIIGVISAVLAGAIGYGAAFGFDRYRPLRVAPLWFGVAGTVLGAIVSAAVIGGWVQASLSWTQEKVAVEQVLPYMALLKTHEAALYERIETSIIRDQADGLSAEQVRANAKTLVMSYVADKTTHLPDQLTYELFATTRDQLGYLAEQSEFQMCADLALGRAKGDIDTKLSPELAERSNNNISRVITTPAEQNVANMPSEQFTAFANQAFADAAENAGIPPEAVDGLLLGSGDAAKACKLMKGFFDAVLAQPVEVAASALRTLTSGERSPTQ